MKERERETRSMKEKGHMQIEREGKREGVTERERKTERD